MMERPEVIFERRVLANMAIRKRLNDMLRTATMSGMVGYERIVAAIETAREIAP